MLSYILTRIHVIEVEVGSKTSKKKKITTDRAKDYPMVPSV